MNEIGKTIESFIDKRPFAFGIYGYGSGIFKQTENNNSQIDLIFVVDDIKKWHHDNMELISPEGLQGAYDVMIKVINALENNYYYVMVCKGEPQLGKRGLYPTISQKGSYDAVVALCDFIAYADGRNDLIGISEIIGQPTDVLIPIVKKLKDNYLLNIQSL